MAEIVGQAEFAQGFVDAVAEVAVVLDERARRLLLGAAARQLGRGGITLVAGVSGASPDTVGRGAAELEAGPRVRGARQWNRPTRICGRRWRSWWTRRLVGIRCRSFGGPRCRR